jgi:hypothetical protein
MSGAIPQNDMAGYPLWGNIGKNVIEYTKAVKEYITKGPRYKFFRDQGQFGATYYKVELSEDELSRIIKRVEKSNQPIETYAELIAEKMGKALDTYQGVLSYYGHIDNIQRLYLAEMALKDGATPAQAIHWANKWQLDYRFIFQLAEKMRSGITGYIWPFISYYVLMAPRILETLVTRPWVLLKYAVLMAAATWGASKLLGVDEEELETAKPEYLKDRPYVMPLPWKDKAGNYVFIDWGYTLPFGGPETAFIDWEDILNSQRGAGMLGTVTNLLNNYDTYRGRPIWAETDTEEEKRAKQIEYIARSLGPGFVNDVMNLYDAYRGEIIKWPYYPQERDLTLTTARALGISTYVGGANEAFAKVRKLQGEISDIRFAINRIMLNPNLSMEEKQDKILDAQEEIMKRTQEIQEIYKNFPQAKPKTEEKGLLEWKK